MAAKELDINDDIPKERKRSENMKLKSGSRIKKLKNKTNLIFSNEQRAARMTSAACLAFPACPCTAWAVGTARHACFLPSNVCFRQKYICFQGENSAWTLHRILPAFAFGPRVYSTLCRAGGTGRRLK